MISIYIKIALRNLVRFKAFSAINIIGLAVGMACCILILLYVFDELSYDRFHAKADRIYRITVDGALGDNEFVAAVSPPTLMKTLIQDYPEVEATTRFKTFGFPVLRYGDKVFSEEKFYWVDSSFFDVFTVEFVRGNPKTALIQPEAVVLTERMAKKYFGNEDPVGKLIN
ncbi:MAG TPA: ABC transporter permease, partial [Ignavibacteriaceae bacterium]|nr:ABC transporter permease [Ignavibacteriaceae bacterium]